MRAETTQTKEESPRDDVDPFAVLRQHRWRGRLLGAIAMLAILGVVNGWYLTMIHVDYEFRPGSELRAVCGALTTHGCAVTIGRFGDVAGIPVSVIGMGGAAVTAMAAANARRRRTLACDPWRSLVFGLAMVSLLASMLMGTFSFIERSFCPFCVAWYGINLLMALSAFGVWRVGGSGSLRGVFGAALGRPGALATVLFVVGISAGYGGYQHHRAAVLDTIAEAVLERLEGEQPVELELDGLHSMGPADAQLTVVELADFECPFCLELWMAVAEFLDKTSFDVRVVFVHFPLDSSCNPGVESIHAQACRAAVAAECAGRHDAFFEYADLLYRNQPAFDPEQLVDYATGLGLPQDEFRACLDDPETEDAVRSSIRQARAMGIETTPTFFVNGYRFKGARDPQWVQLVFDGLARVYERRDDAS